VAYLFRACSASSWQYRAIFGVLTEAATTLE